MSPEFYLDQIAKLEVGVERLIRGICCVGLLPLLLLIINVKSSLHVSSSSSSFTVNGNLKQQLSIIGVYDRLWYNVGLLYMYFMTVVLGPTWAYVECDTLLSRLVTLQWE